VMPALCWRVSRYCGPRLLQGVLGGIADQLGHCCRCTLVYCMRSWYILQCVDRGIMHSMWCGLDHQQRPQSWGDAVHRMCRGGVLGGIERHSMYSLCVRHVWRSRRRSRRCRSGGRLHIVRGPSTEHPHRGQSPKDGPGHPIQKDKKNILSEKDKKNIPSYKTRRISNQTQDKKTTTV
jgi:hypothetical protein